MRDIAREALRAIKRPAEGQEPIYDDRRTLHELTTRARTALADAGYPAEGVWRAVQRASVAIDLTGDSPDPALWRELEAELTEGISTLDGLVGPQLEPDVDFNLVG